MRPSGLRSSVPVAAILLVVLFLSRPLSAQPAQPRSFEATAKDDVTPAAQRAIDAGLAALATRQHPDGSFGSGRDYRRNVAVAALSGMAYLSSGSGPDRGPYGDRVSKTVDFIVASTQPSGFIIREDSAQHGPMYGHGFATLFLAEVYGLSPREDVRKSLKSAVQLIVNSQNKEGGWRYDPDGRDADISVTVCQIMALRAARNCGLHVPKTTVDQCTDYVRKSQVADGGFRYQLSGRPTSAFPRTAAGIVALYSAGIYEGRDIDRGLDYIRRHEPQGDLARYDAYYFYGHYYAVQAMWQSGGDNWKRWYPAIREELLARQLPDGTWSDSLINPEYATAMACLILQMPNNYLPIFQR